MTSLRLPLHRGNLLEFAIAFDYAFDLSWLIIQWYEQGHYFILLSRLVMVWVIGLPEKDDIDASIGLCVQCEFFIDNGTLRIDNLVPIHRDQ